MTTVWKEWLAAAAAKAVRHGVSFTEWRYDPETLSWSACAPVGIHDPGVYRAADDSDEPTPELLSLYGDYLRTKLGKS